MYVVSLQILKWCTQECNITVKNSTLATGNILNIIDKLPPYKGKKAHLGTKQC